jgi:hypothetical protein
VLLVGVVAVASYYLIEQPFLRLRVHVERWLRAWREACRSVVLAEPCEPGAAAAGRRRRRALARGTATGQPVVVEPVVVEPVAPSVADPAPASGADRVNGRDAPPPVR